MKNLYHTFNNLSITYKIIISNSLVILLVASTFTFVSIRYIKNENKELHEKNFSRQVNDIIGLINYAEERVENKEITLEEAKESVKKYVLGIKDGNGNRNLLTSKFVEPESKMLAWANNSNGIVEMNTTDEGKNIWDQKVNGRYVRETWLSLDMCGKLVAEYYQKGKNTEPELWWAYMRYYEPWDWIIGVGGLKQDLYDEPIRELRIELILITILLIIVANVIAYLLIKSISKPIKDGVNLAKQIANGDLSNHIHYLYHDEIGELVAALNMMSDNLQKKIKFAEQIKDGNFKNHFKIDNEKDTLGLALIAMQKNLLENQEQTEKRNHRIQRIEKYNHILRTNSKSIEQLADKLISMIIRDMKAAQGAIFFLKEDQNQKKYLELVSCFAHDRKKFRHKKVSPHEGLVGQVYLEKKHIYVREIPKDYPNITSGLGKVKPKCIVLIPLIYQDDVFGVLELGSVYEYTAEEIEFLETLGEYIASAYSNIWNTEQIKALLAVSQNQEYELRTREEEMRQNMEELQSTQEQNQRKEQEINQHIELYENTLNMISTPVTVMNHQKKAVFVNKIMSQYTQPKTTTETTHLETWELSEIKNSAGTIIGYLKTIPLKNTQT